MCGLCACGLPETRGRRTPLRRTDREASGVPCRSRFGKGVGRGGRGVVSLAGSLGFQPPGSACACGCWWEGRQKKELVRMNETLMAG